MLNFDFQTDLTWLMKISHRLEKFKRSAASSHVYKARCPLCGDSSKSASLARLYFYEKSFQLNVFCHNCGYSHSFFRFMKDAFPNDFPEYKKEQMLERFQRRSSIVPSKEVSTPTKPKDDAKKCTTKLKNCVPIVTLDDDHPAVSYLRKRSFGDRQLERLWYTDNFYDVASDLSCEELSEKFPKDPRIVIPFYDVDGTIEMVQGRALEKTGLRYISIKTDPDIDKIYGKYELDPSRTSYCVEGPLDSLFVDNCIATCDSNLTRATADVYIFDNQPRSKEIVKLMNGAIDSGRSIVIWPHSPDGKEDINDLINEGWSEDELMSTIQSRTFKGLKAKLEFNRWKRV